MKAGKKGENRSESWKRLCQMTVLQLMTAQTETGGLYLNYLKGETNVIRSFTMESKS